MRKSFFKITLILIFLIISIITIVYIYGYKQRERVYYIPYVNMYMKTIWKPFCNYGIILFGKEKKMVYSKKNDYITVYKNVNTLFLFNPNEKNILYIEYERFPQFDSIENRIIIKQISNIKESNNINYKLYKIDCEDIAFFEKKDLNTKIIKQPYIEICVWKYFQGVSINHNKDHIDLVDISN